MHLLLKRIYRPAMRAPDRRRGEVGRQAEGGAAVGAVKSAVIGHAEQQVLRFPGAGGFIRFFDSAFGGRRSGGNRFITGKS